MQFAPIWRHKSVCIFALLAGLSFILPDLIIPAYRHFYQRHYPAVVSAWDNNGSFTSIDLYGHPDNGFYAARASAASRQGIARDPFLDENKSSRLATLDQLTFVFVGALSRLTGHIESGWILARFLGGVFWVLALYAILFKMTSRVGWSMLAALLIAIFWDFFMLIPFELAPRNVITSLYFYMGHFRYNFGATRMLSPALSYPPFFIASFFMMRTRETGRIGPALMAGVIGGALAYIHTDVWTTFMGAGVFYIGLCVYKNRKIPAALLAAWGIAFAVSLPWIAYNLPLSPDVLSRSELTLGRTLDWQGVWLALGAYACTRIGLKKYPDFLFIAAVLWATAAAMEVQLVRGYTIQSFHWFRAGNTFLFAGAAAWVGLQIQDRRDYLWACILVLVFSACRAAAYAAQRYPYQALRQDDETALAFLQAQSQPGSRVAVLNPLDTLLIPIYTANKTLIPSGFPLVCDLPTEDILQRLRGVEHLYGIPEDRLIAGLRGTLNNPADVMGDLLWAGKADWTLAGWKEFFYIYTHLAPPDHVIADLERLKTLPFPADLKADYFWVGPFERGLMNSKIPSAWGKPVFTNATVAIYAPAGAAMTALFSASGADVPPTSLVCENVQKASVIVKGTLDSFEAPVPGVTVAHFRVRHSYRGSFKPGDVILFASFKEGDKYPDRFLGAELVVFLRPRKSRSSPPPWETATDLAEFIFNPEIEGLLAAQLKQTPS